MKRLSYIVALVLVAFVSLFTSCDDGETKKGGKATAKILSGPYELLLVAHKSWLASGDGMEFRNIVERPILGIPQAEPNFRVTTLEPRDYKGKYIMYGNIFIADIDENVEQASLDIQYDVNAQPQVIVTVKAPTTNRLMIFLENKKDSILNVFVQHELEREKKFLEKNYSREVLTQAKKIFGASILAPVDIETVTPHDNFFWATSKKRDNTLNVCMYTFPYTSEDDFSMDKFVQKRDSVMKLYVQGDRDDQYMRTDARNIYENATIRDGKFVYEVRGLWVMEHDAMGGPFVSYSTLDAETNQVVVVEGFIYAPQEKKRPLIRELEACLQTLKLHIGK